MTLFRATALAAVGAIVVVLGVWASGAHAHSWYTGLSNPDGQICCGGTDCGPVADEDVTPIKGGYAVHIPMFDPMATGKGPAIYTTIPNARAKPAREGGQYHLCYWGGEVKCFFFPAPAY